MILMGCAAVTFHSVGGKIADVIDFLSGEVERLGIGLI
jgi:hypothetical protein